MEVYLAEKGSGYSKSLLKHIHHNDGLKDSLGILIYRLFTFKINTKVIRERLIM